MSSLDKMICDLGRAYNVKYLLGNGLWREFIDLLQMLAEVKQW